MGPGAAIKWGTTAHETGHEPLLFLSRQLGDPDEGYAVVVVDYRLRAQLQIVVDLPALAAQNIDAGQKAPGHIGASVQTQGMAEVMRQQIPLGSVAADHFLARAMRLAIFVESFPMQREERLVSQGNIRTKTSMHKYKIVRLAGIGTAQLQKVNVLLGDDFDHEIPQCFLVKLGVPVTDIAFKITQAHLVV